MDIPSDGKHMEKAELRDFFFVGCIICTVGSPGRKEKYRTGS